MKGSLYLLIEFFTRKQDHSMINFPLLITIIVVLLVALWICVSISRRNKLYIGSEKRNKKLRIIKENEAA